MKPVPLSTNLVSPRMIAHPAPPRRSPGRKRLRDPLRTDEAGIPEVAMTEVLTKKCASHVRRDSTKSIEYRLIFSVCFLVFLVAGAVERLSPWSWLAQEHEAGPSSSIIAQAWGAACTCTAYAFMG